MAHRFKIAVLMSTYNGEAYLIPQIESILSQKEVEVTLYCRDDGSVDRTGEILRSWSGYPIKLHFGKNVGVACSFMDLLYHVPEKYDYYAFSDQDDIWKPDKLISAIRFLEKERGPHLYVSNQTLIDAESNVIGIRYPDNPDLSYLQILCSNQAPGCTMVWNASMHALLSDPKRRPSSELLHRRIHDVWVAMAAAVIGGIVYDPEGAILYRQHGHNVVGVERVPRHILWKRKLMDRHKRNGRSILSKEILERFGDLITDVTIIDNLLCFATYRSCLRSKIKLIKNKELIKHSGESRAEFCLKVLTNLF